MLHIEQRFLTANVHNVYSRLTSFECRICVNTVIHCYFSWPKCIQSPDPNLHSRSQPNERVWRVGSLSTSRSFGTEQSESSRSTWIGHHSLCNPCRKSRRVFDAEPVDLVVRRADLVKEHALRVNRPARLHTHRCEPRLRFRRLGGEPIDEVVVYEGLDRFAGFA